MDREIRARQGDIVSPQLSFQHAQKAFLASEKLPIDLILRYMVYTIDEAPEEFGDSGKKKIV